jgi:hypothetical protein
MYSLMDDFFHYHDVTDHKFPEIEAQEKGRNRLEKWKGQTM